MRILPSFCLSSVSFISVLHFSEYKSFSSLVQFILRHYILFEAIVNEMVMLIPLYHSLLLATVYFCVLNFGLYWVSIAMGFFPSYLKQGLL